MQFYVFKQIHLQISRRADQRKYRLCGETDARKKVLEVNFVIVVIALNSIE